MEKAKILGGENGDFGIFFFLSSSSSPSFFNFGLIIYMNLYMGLMNLDLDLERFCGVSVLWWWWWLVVLGCNGGGWRYCVAVVVVSGVGL